jgi:tRNA-uridine 2-sulfurtransferase
MKKRQKVIVAMSGGVDSSVAALLMKNKGYEVIGVFLKCWSGTKEFSGECSWKEERRYAIKICNILQIPLVTVDAEKEYKQYVVDEMFKDYKKGITPNPDVLCNEAVKFPFLFRQAKKFNADFIVTGHFAKIKKSDGKHCMYRADDESKDQSYFLYRLKEKDLQNIKFPIGKYTKAQVRKIALENGFVNHEKKSTVGICFIGKIDMKEFLQSKIKPRKGNIIDEAGNVLGVHDGIYYYTIGQRLGPRFDLDIKKVEKDKQNMSRWYVAKKDVKKNILVVAPSGSKLLLRDSMAVEDFHLINGGEEEFKKSVAKKNLNLHVRIRHVGELVPASVSYDKKLKKVCVKLKKKLTGVSNGQAIIFYKGKLVLGGGTIKF